jgi:hypothetical protein
MSLLSSATVLRLVDSMAILLSQAYQLARARLASAASPIVRLLVQRDQAFTEVDLLRREAEIFRAQRESIPPHRRPDYRPEQCWRSCNSGDYEDGASGRPRNASSCIATRSVPGSGLGKARAGRVF